MTAGRGVRSAVMVPVPRYGGAAGEPIAVWPSGSGLPRDQSRGSESSTDCPRGAINLNR